MELNHNGVRSFAFHALGCEMLASLEGVPGARVIEFFKGGSCPIPYGNVSLPVLLRDPWKKGGWRGTLAPRGDIEGAKDEELVLLDIGVIETLAAWAQEAALGRVESTEE